MVVCALITNILVNDLKINVRRSKPHRRLQVSRDGRVSRSPNYKPEVGMVLWFSEKTTIILYGLAKAHPTFHCTSLVGGKRSTSIRSSVSGSQAKFTRIIEGLRHASCNAHNEENLVCTFIFSLHKSIGQRASLFNLAWSGSSS